jgi:DNA recombination-dependent growth factor C
VNLFKNATVYQFSDLAQNVAWPVDQDFELPMVMMSKSALVNSIVGPPRALAICMRTKVRRIPAQVAKKALKLRVEEFHARTGQWPTKSQRKTLKDEVLATLALQAFVVETDVWAYFDLTLGYLIIDTASAAVAERMAGLITSSGMSSLRAIPAPLGANEVLTELAIGAKKSEWEVGGSAQMQSYATEAKATLVNAGKDELDALEGTHCSVTRLELSDANIRFVVDVDFVFRGIKIKTAGRDYSADESLATICVLELRSMIRSVAELLAIQNQ